MVVKGYKGCCCIVWVGFNEGDLGVSWKFRYVSDYIILVVVIVIVYL